VAFRAVLFEQNGAGSNGVRIVLERIWAVARLCGRLLQFRVDGWIASGRGGDGWFAGTSALRQDHGHDKK